MAKLKLKIEDKVMAQLSASAERLWPGEGICVVKAITHLVKSGDLCFWLSPRFERRFKAFAAEHQRDSRQGTGEVDELLFLLWLRQETSMEINLQWEVESLPNNGGIYRILLKGGQDGKDAHNSQG